MLPRFVAGGLRLCGLCLFRIFALAGMSGRALRRVAFGTSQASAGACAPVFPHVCQFGVVRALASCSRPAGRTPWEPTLLGSVGEGEDGAAGGCALIYKRSGQ